MKNVAVMNKFSFHLKTSHQNIDEQEQTDSVFQNIMLKYSDLSKEQINNDNIHHQVFNDLLNSCESLNHKNTLALYYPTNDNSTNSYNSNIRLDRRIQLKKKNNTYRMYVK